MDVNLNGVTYEFRLHPKNSDVVQHRQKVSVTSRKWQRTSFEMLEESKKYGTDILLRLKQTMRLQIDHLRIVLDTDNGVPIYWGMDAEGDEVRQVAKHDALTYLRKGMRCFLAVADPTDRNSHYETTQTIFFRV